MTYCPWCYEVCETHEGIEEGGEPNEGDVTVCWRCYQISVFTGTGSLRCPTREEYVEAVKNPDLRRALAMLRDGKFTQHTDLASFWKGVHDDD